jgi:outer membrane protein assembly factor BamA
MVAAAALTWRAVRLRVGARAPVLLFILLLLITYPLNAQSAKYEGKPVVGIQFDPAEQVLEDEDLQAAMGTLQVGQPLRLRDVRTAIEGLYATGRYADIAVDAREEANGVALTFQARHARFIRNIIVTGVPEPPSAGQLVNATKLQLGTRFDRAQVRQSVGDAPFQRFLSRQGSA